MTGTLKAPPLQPESSLASSPSPLLPKSADPEDDDIDQPKAMEIDIVPDPSPKPPSSGGGKGRAKRRLPSKSRKRNRRLTLNRRSELRAAAEEKLRTLTDLVCQPFVPSSDLDVSKHEQVFRALGIWDFANMKLADDLRKDLILELIASYDHLSRRSYMRNVWVGLTQIAFSRALCLPKTKSQVSQSDKVLFEEEGTKDALRKFLQGWILLVGEVGIIPPAAEKAIWLIESGRPHLIDWAELISCMVDKELQDGYKSGFCHYASHLQKLMEYQKPALFEIEEEEPPRVVPVAAGEEDHDEEDVMVSATEVFHVESTHPDKVKQVVTADAMSLRLGSIGDDGNVDQASQQEPCADRRNDIHEHSLMPCSTNNMRSMEVDVGASEGKDEMTHMENHETHENDFTSKFPNLDNSVDLLGCMNAGNVSFMSSLQQPLDSSPVEFLDSSPTEEEPKNVQGNLGTSSPSLFRNIGKRPAEDINGNGEGSGDEHHFSHGGTGKRQRADESWEQTPSAIMEQAMSLLEKARFMQAEKEQDMLNSHIQLQYLTELVQQKDQILQSIERSRLEDQHRMQHQLAQFEHERTAMSHMIIGYQKTLREVRQSFTDYRKRYSNDVEPLYKDVPGSSGVVLTVREIERQQLEKSELEKRILEKKVLENNIIIKMLLNFSNKWSRIFDKHENDVGQLAKRLEIIDSAVKISVKFLKDHVMKNKHPYLIKLQKAGNKHSVEKLKRTRQTPCYEK